MIEQKEELNQKQIAALFYAVNEKNITPQDILAELLPLVDSYFICKTEVSEGEAVLKFLNGQSFILSVKTV